MLEATAMGAAHLAGLGVGFWQESDLQSSHDAAARIFARFSAWIRVGFFSANRAS